MAANKTILLKGLLGRRREEADAIAAITPGHMIEIAPTGLQPHSVRGGKWGRAVAIEDSFQGRTIADAYDTTTYKKTQYLYLEPGDVFNALLHGGENVAIGDWAIGYGDGTVAKAATAFLANIVADSDPSPVGTALAAFSNGTVSIPANTLKVGDTIRVRATVVVTNQNSTDTLTLTLKIGSTTIVATGAVDVATGDVGLIDAVLVIRTIGASGTFVASGSTNLGVPGTATTRAFMLASTAIDTTAAQSITMNYTWSVSHADNDAVLRTLLVEHVKAGSSADNGSEGGQVIGHFEEALDLSLETDPDRVAVLVV